MCSSRVGAASPTTFSTSHHREFHCFTFPWSSAQGLSDSGTHTLGFTESTKDFTLQKPGPSHFFKWSNGSLGSTSFQETSSYHRLVLGSGRILHSRSRSGSGGEGQQLHRDRGKILLNDLDGGIEAAMQVETERVFESWADGGAVCGRPRRFAGLRLEGRNEG